MGCDFESENCEGMLSRYCDCLETRYSSQQSHSNQKPKGKKLTKRQKLYNHLLSKKRIIVDNIIIRCKIFRITKDVYSGKHKNHNKVWNLVAGLVNLRYGEVAI